MNFLESKCEPNNILSVMHSMTLTVDSLMKKWYDKDLLAAVLLEGLKFCVPILVNCQVSFLSGSSFFIITCTKSSSVRVCIPSGVMKLHYVTLHALGFFFHLLDSSSSLSLVASGANMWGQRRTIFGMDLREVHCRKHPASFIAGSSYGIFKCVQKDAVFREGRC